MATKKKNTKAKPNKPNKKNSPKKTPILHKLKSIKLPQIKLKKLKKKKLPKFSIAKKYLIITTIISLLFLTGGIIYLFRDVPSPTSLTRNPAPISTEILDRNGNLLYQVYSDQNRTPISIQDLPEYIPQATIAIEDQNFYSHFGLDFIGILRAAYKTLSGQRLEGGSTITQQLVKTALLNDPRRTITRKIKEAALAIITEIVYSKDQILEMYLNNAPYGGTAYGIETASRQYFGKSAKDLSLAEAALIAGLPQAPTKYSPFGARPELGKQRQELVLSRMVEEGYISKEQAEEAISQELEYAEDISIIKAPHFVLWVKDILVQRYGEELVNLGGLRVTTSLDLDIQEAAQASLSAEVNSLKRLKVGNGAAIVTKPNTGQVIAMIGSKDYFNTEEDGNVNVTLARRQPGSSIKPINYALGLYKGWPASQVYLDIPTCFNSTGQPEYCPKNYDDTSHGPVQMRMALANSYNITAIKQIALNGIEDMVATASAMGITGWDNPDNYGLSLTLGGGEVRMVDMAVAFGVFANQGVKVPLNPILKVETHDGQVIEEVNLDEIKELVNTGRTDYQTFQEKIKNDPDGLIVSKDPVRTINLNITSPYFKLIDKITGKVDDTTEEIIDTADQLRTVLPEEVTYIISDILADNGARTPAFGASSELVIRGKTVSVKTGTTNDLRDNWTIGYTPDYLVATWVGNNDNTPMSYVASGVTGASPIWHDIITYTLKNEPDHEFTKPVGVVDAQVCTLTGLLAVQENQCETRTELFIKDLLPPPTYPTRKQIWIRRDNHQPLMPGEEVIDLDLEEHTVIHDPFTSDFCLDCAYPQETKPDPNDPNNQVPTGKISFPEYKINYDLFKATLPTPKNWLTRVFARTNQ